MRFIVNGAGIAGPTLAWWLARAGHEITLVERAPAPRTGGYVIDFWGVGFDIAERMGVLPRILEHGYRVRDVRFLDRLGRTVGGFSAAIFGRLTHDRFTSVRRSDVAAAILDTLRGRVEMRFGDSVSAIDDTGDGVHVRFEHSPPCHADLVIGADGLHSRVRELMFGDEAPFAHALGYHAAAFEAEDYRPRDELAYVTYAVPGRQISRFAMRDDRTLFLCVFRDEYMRPADPSTDAERRACVRQIYEGLGWECGRIMTVMSDAPDVYFDAVSQIRMSHWSRGRAALVGDAAACVSLLAGEGTGLAMAEAYVLAAELIARPRNHAAAFAAYEQRMMPFLARKQRAAAKFASSFAPRTAHGLAFRNLVTRLARVPVLAEWLLARDLFDKVELPTMP